jgi:hypothetical protein
MAQLAEFGAFDSDTIRCIDAALPGDGFGRDDVVAGYHPDKNTGALALVDRISDSLPDGILYTEDA